MNIDSFFFWDALVPWLVLIAIPSFLSFACYYDRSRGYARAGLQKIYAAGSLIFASGAIMAFLCAYLDFRGIAGISSEFEVALGRAKVLRFLSIAIFLLIVGWICVAIRAWIRTKATE